MVSPWPHVQIFTPVMFLRRWLAGWHECVSHGRVSMHPYISQAGLVCDIVGYGESDTEPNMGTVRSAFFPCQARRQARFGGGHGAGVRRGGEGEHKQASNQYVSQPQSLPDLSCRSQHKAQGMEHAMPRAFAGWRPPGERQRCPPASRPH